ncbi:MAG: metallophosphoesterase [Candidatus Limnocylindrales bacterium]
MRRPHFRWLIPLVAVTLAACLLAAIPPTPAAGVSVVLVGAGDIASCGSSGDTATAALVKGISGTVFTAGDNVYDDGSATEYAECYHPTWGAFRDRTRPSPGNHDYHVDGAAGYFGYFGSRAGNPSRGYYAYNLGNWRIYALNSNCGEIGGCAWDSPQTRWLRADLAGHPHRCVLAYWHHPLFSSGPHGNQPQVRPLWRALYRARAEIVINGHDHLYERFRRQSPRGVATSAGIQEFIVGTGGRSHYGFETIKANSRSRNATTYGVLKLTLRRGEYSWRFVPVAGKTFTDRGTRSCH